MRKLDSFGVVVFSSMPPQVVAGLVAKISGELAQVQVRGVLYEARPPQSVSQRMQNFLRNLRDSDFVIYATRRILNAVGSQLGAALLHFVHAYAGPPSTAYTLDHLGVLCRKIGGSLFVTADIHSPEALEFVRKLDPDLGIVYGTRVLKPGLFNIPKRGSINLHKRKVPNYRGGGPVGLWELLDGQKEIGVTVHAVEAKVDTGAVVGATTIPIEMFDNLTSLRLKADLIGDELLVQAISDFATGSVTEDSQQGPGRTFKMPAPQLLACYERQIGSSRPAFRPRRGRSAGKLLLRTVLLGPYVICRNWVRRFRGAFPVVILFHHVVTDRPHRLGMPTVVFNRHTEFLGKYYRVVGLREAIAMLRSRAVTAPTVVLTFDDGYADNFINVRAVSQELGVPATFFVCTGKVSLQEQFEHDLKNGETGFPPLTWGQLACLKKSGYEVGSHTRSHFDCGRTDVAALQQEILGSKRDLEERLGSSAEFFSFPWGHPRNMSHPALEMVKTSYMCAFSAHGGANFPRRDGEFWLLKRCGHPNDLWELELTLQSVLDLNLRKATSRET